jgi:predicted nucleic acid-binding protein
MSVSGPSSRNYWRSTLSRSESASIGQRVILDAGPLGKIAHPRRNPEVNAWYTGLLAAGVTVIIPEIADYEVRRELLLAGLSDALRRLDGLKLVLVYLPLSTEAMHRAAELWAIARRSGQPTADRHALDGDVILAAQAEEAGGIVATDNVRHLARFVDAREWRDIS